ncbi:PEP-CTERM sorting domain-containing protein [Massilia scottii]|uniref:PEP-CTERM sorting domain-containing protein n=1 Tax=Massilia scottii TaxID=3057166 RepID=UPI002796DF94|nr:PEP-CTERM sorting domain-containing protein [Massilia sp. CCM 9029]MDQ1830077.1 PEP-CTERM sorting domain-containing protein [Massilia sp. CCM 9029]
MSTSHPAFALALLLSASAAAAAPAAVPTAVRSYTVTVLPDAMSPAGINNAGQIVGTRNGQAYLWSAGGGIDLGTLGGTSSTGTALNRFGEVTGGALTASGDEHAFIYSKGVMTDLGTIGGGTMTRGTAINDRGQVAGNFYAPATGWGAFVGEGGLLRDIGNLGGASIWASGINNAGRVVGSSLGQGEFHPPQTAFVYENGAMSALNYSPSGSSSANAVNQAGQITGTDWHGPESAYLYTNGMTQVLGSMYGLAAWGTALNNRGEVVGNLGGALQVPFFAFIYANGRMSDLNTLIDPALGWTVQSAAGINDLGQIAAYGCHDSEGCGGLLLELTSPVPEPQAQAMLLAGLALLGLAWRRGLSAACRCA